MNGRVMGPTLGLPAMLLAGGGAMAANTETVPVGNAGNAADTRYNSSGYGAEFLIVAG